MKTVASVGALAAVSSALMALVACSTDPALTPTEEARQALATDRCGAQRTLTSVSIGCTFTTVGPTQPRETVPADYAGTDTFPLADTFRPAAPATDTTDTTSEADAASTAVYVSTTDAGTMPDEEVGLVLPGRRPPRPDQTKYNYEVVSGQYVASGAGGKEQVLCSYRLRGCGWQAPTTVQLGGLSCVDGSVASNDPLSVSVCQPPVLNAPTVTVAFDLPVGYTLPENSADWPEALARDCFTASYNEPRWPTEVWAPLVAACGNLGVSVPTAATCCVDNPTLLPMPTPVGEIGDAYTYPAK